MSETRVAQRAVPMISYEDVGAAVDWLCAAFGFRESDERYTDDEGRVTHAELELDGAGAGVAAAASPTAAGRLGAK